MLSYNNNSEKVEAVSAKGSGASVQDVNKLIKQFEDTRKMMKMMGDKSKMMQMMKNMPKMPGGMRR